MRPNKPNPQHLIFVIYFHNYSVVVAFDIENNSIVAQETGRRIFSFDNFCVLPFCLACFLIPRFQLLFTIWMLFPKLPKYLLSNYSQASTFAEDNKSSRIGIFLISIGVSKADEIAWRPTTNRACCCGIH